MADNLSNYIKIDGNKIAGNLATMSFDIDVTGEGVYITSDKSPVFRLYAQSPRERRINVGGIRS